MFYQEHSPHLGLQNHLKCYWSLSIAASGPAQAGQHVLTEGVECSFNLADPLELASQTQKPVMARQSCICGPMTRPLWMRPTGRVEIFGVCFRPGGAYPFFPYPAKELLNGYVALDDLWGSTGLGVVARILDGCHTTKERIDFLDRHFLHHLEINPREDSCLAAALKAIEAHQGRVNIDRLSGSVGLSARQLERRFQERVGLSPKQLCRSLRFKQVFKHLAAAPTDSWVSTALACGYYDQSHMIRDFKHYTGASPAAYFSQPQAAAGYFTGNF